MPHLPMGPSNPFIFPGDMRKKVSLRAWQLSYSNAVWLKNCNWRPSVMPSLIVLIRAKLIAAAIAFFIISRILCKSRACLKHTADPMVLMSYSCQSSTVNLILLSSAGAMWSESTSTIHRLQKKQIWNRTFSQHLNLSLWRAWESK